MTTEPLKPLTIQITRDASCMGGTLGTLMLFVGDAMVYKCYTLEDPVRPKGVKVYGDTAIPEGTYKARMTFSNRFQKILPEILDVPGFQGVRFHGGNSKADSHGCILLGTQLQGINPSPRIGICLPAVARVSEYITKHGEAAVTIRSKT